MKRYFIVFLIFLFFIHFLEGCRYQDKINNDDDLESDVVYGYRDQEYDLSSFQEYGIDERNNEIQNSEKIYIGTHNVETIDIKLQNVDMIDENNQSGKFDLVEYTGPLYHVFYHFLIAFPEIAYKTSYGNAMDLVCVTPTEFTSSLLELYNNNFVLMDINQYITVNEDGSVSQAKIMVPKGKKPLIMSFDDINYYSKNHGLGICDKIILDNNGDFAMLTLQKDGTELITYNNGVVPLLEQFCKEYPDFSPFGDKGILALTGYDGILGYRTNQYSENREEEMEAVRSVVEALKNSGWKFASHSYGHIHTNAVSTSRIESDTKKWMNEVASLVGDTMIYVFPYGEYDKNIKEKTDILLENGYKILCGVGMEPYSKFYKNYFFMDRQFVDGTSLRKYKDLLKPLMDSDYVYCKEERP